MNQELPDDMSDFSGKAEFKLVRTASATSEEIISDTYIKYFLHGILHRDDGPAVLRNGKPHQWWINGKHLTEEEFNQWLSKKNLNEKLQSSLSQSTANKRGRI